MTDPKPTVDEALEAVVVLAKHSEGFDDQIDTIRAVLELAAREEAAWSEIEKHRSANRTHVSFTLGYYRGPTIEILGRGGASLRECEGATRLETIEAAAAWAKEQQP